MKSIPMNIDNVDYQMSYIRSDEAGKFLTFLVDKDVKGAINGASDGTISIKEIIEYVEEKTGARAIIDNSGEDAPYNGEPEYSICTDKAKELGYQFTELKDWMRVRTKFWTTIGLRKEPFYVFKRTKGYCTTDISSNRVCN